MKKYIEKEIDKHIQRIRPELLNRVLIRVTRETNPDHKDNWAYIMTDLHPPVITIQVNAIAKYLNTVLTDNIIEVLRHEFSHLLVGHSELKAQSEEKKLHIFKDEKYIKPIKGRVKIKVYESTSQHKNS